MPKQSFAPDANAAARCFLHLCIRKFPEEDFSLAPKCQSQTGLILVRMVAYSLPPSLRRQSDRLFPERVVGLVRAKSRPQEELYW